MAILSELPEQEAAAEYDVFLSFRGKDTRLTFIDHLYQALINENIHTFLDEEDVESGEELKPKILRAIKGSRASIIVLSENYASSTWCLDELVMILEQRRTSNHIVLPIFYHVEPTHVRKQGSSFGDAMVIHKRRMMVEKDKEKKIQYAHKMELWKNGLTEVADLKGKDADGCRETLFIEEIVEEINRRLGLHLACKGPRLMGMDLSVHTISTWLKEKSSKTADILTIWGMAGIGKTTLAEYIYRLHCHKFERSSFVEGIERKSTEQSSTLLDIQKQLLGDILKKRNIEVRDINVCTTKLEKALLSKQTLVVLDDIDRFEQLDGLIGTKGFHPGSKIIITTKDGSLTEKCALFRTTFPPKHTKHKLSGLNHTDSLRVFCWHAFGANVPKKGYEEEAKKVAKYCAGHPLGLKVLGSSLINEDVDTWGDIFEMLETKAFNSNIHKVLRISFDSLPTENCKELFKHIACFFVGKDRELTETILKECGIHTSYGITKLIDRCLLEIGADNELKMHQLVQDMGRYLIHEESPMKPWKRSRLWNHEDCLNLLKENKGTTNVQGLLLDMKMLEQESLRESSSMTDHKFQDDLNMNSRGALLIHRIYDFFLRIWGAFSWFFLLSSSSHSKKVELRTNALKKMDNLKLLQLNHVKLNGSYKSFPKGLKWLCMHGFRSKYIPSELPLEKLVALDMSYSDLEQLWNKPKLLGSLKILNLSYSKLVRVAGFSGLPTLERLILKGCSSLILVCESIGRCDRLVLLDMSYCKNLKLLPSSISKLKKLKMLTINGCIGISEFPIEMRDIESLKVLKIDSVSMNSYASSSTDRKLVRKRTMSLFFSLPPSLVILSLKDNNLSNESFPMDFSSMPMLKELYLDENPIDSMPDCVRSLNKLEILSVVRCFRLKSVMDPPSTLKVLSVEKCASLLKITFHPEMPRPPFIDYEDAESLNEIQGIIKSQALAQVDEDILCALGWTFIKYMKDHELKIMIPNIWVHPKKLPVQMYYEFGIFSMCFIGKEVPNWLAHKSNGSTISFVMPSSSMNRRIQGFNICSVHTFLGNGELSFLGINIRNMTQNRTWMYFGAIYAVREVDEDIVWLSHWMFCNNEFEDGDEVFVTILEVEKDGVIVKECGINLVYNDRDDMEDDPLGYYKSWKYIIGGDLSDFQVPSGNWYLFHARFVALQSAYLKKHFMKKYIDILLPTTDV